MADLTLEQKREIALAEARMRAAESEGTRKNTISAKGLRGFESNAGGAAFGNPNLRAGADRGGEMSDIPYIMGGNASEAASKMGASPEVAGGIGTAVNFGLNAAPMFVGGGFGGAAGKAAAPVVEGTARALMRSAMKPLATIDPATKERAVTTMLENRANQNVGGIRKLLEKEAGLAEQERALVAPSNKAIDVNAATGQLDALASRLDIPGIPRSDVATVDRIKQEFLSHPNLQTRSKLEAELERQIAEKEAARVSALQDAGRFQTFEAQQANLANGGGITLRPDMAAGRTSMGTARPAITGQTINEPYMNVGVTGERALSPSAYPPSTSSGIVRMPGRYTENAQRVPEGASAADAAMKIAQQRKMEADFLKYQLDSLRAHQQSGMTVQDAQKSKQAIYQWLGDRAYTGELKGAETEAAKALARGLREHLEKAIPEVGPINKERSKLIEAIKIATRRDAVEGNKNPFGLSLLAHSPQVALAMMADRSATFRSALANFMYANKTAIPTTIGAATGAGAGAATGYGNLNELQRR